MLEARCELCQPSDALLDRARAAIAVGYAPDRYNSGLNVGETAGRHRMDAHAQSIRRPARVGEGMNRPFQSPSPGRLDDPGGSVRCAFARKPGA